MEIRHGHAQSIEGDHGRIETRDTWVTDQLDWLGQQRAQWAGLAAVAVVQSVREVPATGVKNTSIERRYYITSRSGTDAPALAQAVRGHWAVENQLHWALDVSFAEDAARHRKGHSAQNFSRLRRISLNLLQRDKSRKRGIKGKRLIAAWDHDYLLKLLTA